MKIAGQAETLIQNVGYQFEAILEEQAKAFVKEVTTYALKQEKISSAHLSYVFWVLFEGESHWPEMLAYNKTVLGHALQIVSDTDNTPRYSATFQVAPTGVEEKVDRVVEHMGLWSRTVLMVAVFKGWLAIIEKAAPQVPKVTGDEVTAAQAKSWLHHFLRGMLSLRQGWWHYPTLMLRLIAAFPQPK